MRYSFYVYLLVMALVTYLIRMIPLALVKKKITNKWLLSFLYYVPYSVLAAMTLPACLYATSSFVGAIVGTLAALALAWRGKSLLTVAAGAVLGVFLTDLVVQYLLPLF